MEDIVIENGIDFDVTKEIEQALEKLKKTRQKNYKRSTSRLNRYQAQLVAMRRAGATMAILQEWLKSHHCRVAQSTIWRFLRDKVE